MAASSKYWATFMDQCLERRIRAEDFQLFTSQLYIKSPLSGAKLASILLNPRSYTTNCVDPLIPLYTERLLSTGRIDASDVLSALFHGSQDNLSKNVTDQPLSTNPPELEELFLQRFTSAVINSDRPRTLPETRNMLTILSQWMSASVSAGTSDSMIQALTGNIQQAQVQSAIVRESLARLVIALLENQVAVTVLMTRTSKDFRKSFGKSLSLFISFLSQTSVETANRLEGAQKQHGLVDDTSDETAGNATGNGLDVSTLQLEATVDLPLYNSRAGLYVFINSLLFARPLTDDSMILNYLQLRYKGDVGALVIDLVTSSFDVLSNAMYRGESSQTMFNFKSFLINKVPTLLVVLSGSLFPPLTLELCISQALSQIDSNAFPSFSEGFDPLSGTSSLSDVRQDFLFACALHRLIAESSIETLLGEAPMTTLPEGGKYIKENLINLCTANFGRLGDLIKELENFNGNTGAIVGTITELVSTMCQAKETMSLKTVCNSLSRKPQSLDVILQFTSPASILQPLCNLLDSWRYEDDQGEYQPVYDEFGGILLLVLAFVYRYNLSTAEIGIPHSSFVAQLVENGHLAYGNDELDEAQNKHLGAWLRGLFDTDGLSDEVMSSCRPQEFYLLVPTLLRQTVFACSADILGIDTIKAGLEYLLETFLLPSLVSAVSWIANHTWEQSNQDVEIIMQILSKLIRPTSMSGDAQAMHTTILAIVSRRLDKALRLIRKRYPKRPDIEPLLDALKPHLQYERTPYGTLTELESWTSSGTSTKLSLRSTVQSLTLWSASGGQHMTAPSYTHRMLSTFLALIPAPTLLRAILEETKAQSEAGNAATVLDVATALICAPSHLNSPVPVAWPAVMIPAPQLPRDRLNLRDALRLERDEASDLLPSDHLLAETIVRLSRKVEAQCAPATTAMQSLALSGVDAPMQDMMGLNIQVQDVDVAATMERPLEVGVGLDDAGMDLDLGGVVGGGFDMGSMGGEVGGSVGEGLDGDADVFAGLMLDPDINYE
ncbi:Med5-domain-containing protein [Patellaria atrata CBS 101060]|uniref:Mediator of RNA polymerase II transcription subunit 5 n=1 Tax=Patellaria atrata CBS 101060 TaxID=1346257 RepID=A0A9P4SDN8_9PEZI|nr:Med5-domain-containing protein [Patellaria atrata CBS 101060]